MKSAQPKPPEDLHISSDEFDRLMRKALQVAPEQAPKPKPRSAKKSARKVAKSNKT